MRTSTSPADTRSPWRTVTFSTMPVMEAPTDTGSCDPSIRPGGRRSGASLVMSLSSNSTAPLSGAIKAPSTEIRLVLPLPDGPEMTVKTPGLSARSTSLSAVMRAAPDPKPKLTARSSTSGTEHPPGIDPQRRPRRNQRSEDAKQRERSGDDEVHPVWNGQPAHHQTQHGGEGRHDEQSEESSDNTANQRLDQNDGVHVAIGRAHRLHGGIFLDVLGRDAVDRLCDQDEADAETQDCGDGQCSARSGLHQPEDP